MHKVLVLDGVSEAGLAILRSSCEVEVSGPLKGPELADRIAGYEALVVRSQSTVTAEVFAKADRLRVVARAGVGVDNIDVDAATRAGVVVVNSPEGNTIAAAEHALALMLASARHVPLADRQMRQGGWRTPALMGVEVYGKTLGVVGLGKIGSHVAKAARAMGMSIVAYDPFISAEQLRARGAEPVGLDELLGRADFVTLHVPLTPDTRHMIGAEQLAMMKPGARLINCARGGLVEEQALATALKEGRIAGAALDVFEQEPLAESPLKALDNVILTPHLGAATEEAQVNVAVDVAEQIVQVLSGHAAKSAVNLPGMSQEVLSEVGPYLPLAEHLGALASQLLSTPASQLEVAVGGELVGKSASALGLAAVKGFLQSALGARVNYVNAPLKARERGLAVVESQTHSHLDYTNLLTVTVQGQGEARQVAGTLIGHGEERLVGVDGYALNCAISPIMLFVRHQDEPGMVGKLGTLLGQNQINIAGMQVGRSAVRGAAVMVVNIDDPLPKELLEELRLHPGFNEARQVNL